MLTFEKTNPNDIPLFSPTRRVGGEVSDGFIKARHGARMWSMEDIFNTKELLAWLKRGNKEGLEFVLQPKFDGASLNLLYEDGILIRAITRGDGVTGEDVTNNAKVIKNIPLRISYKERIEIRGEVVIAKADFDEINTLRMQNGESQLSNPRNAAAGSLRQLDSTVTAARRLQFKPWGYGEHSLSFKTYSEMMEFIYSQGFEREEFFKVCYTIEQIEEAYKQLIAQRDSKPFMMDGLVIRIQDILTSNELGYTEKFPKYMVAYKFPAIEKTTRLLDVIFQVGRTGIITPVGVLEPINIDGVNVKSVTLHNFNEIERLGIQKRDIISIIRSGDVIPKITSVFKQRRDGSQTPIKKPDKCPVCGSILLNENTFVKCQNLECKARVVNSVIFFASKKCLDIDGLGDVIVNQLFEAGLITKISDLYKLTTEDLVKLDGFKHKKIRNLLDAIEASKTPPLHRFITSLGIDHIGEMYAKKIAQIYPERWRELNIDEVASIEGFGEIIAKSYIEFMRVNKRNIDELLHFINPQVPTYKTTHSAISGKTFVITGTLGKSRDELRAILERNGARVVNTVSKKVDFVLYGKEAGSKLDKAHGLNITAITEDDLKHMIEI